MQVGLRFGGVVRAGHGRRSALQRTHPVADPVAEQLHIFRFDVTADAFGTPFGPRISIVGRARIKSDVRRVVLKAGQRPPRMIPTRHDDDVMRAHLPQQGDGKFRVLPRGAGFAFQNDGSVGHAVPLQQLLIR